MASPRDFDLDRYRPVCCADGSLVVLTPHLPGEVVALALDLERWTLVRLHRIVDGRRREPDFHPVAEAVQALRRSLGEGIFRLFSWGCVGEDWCYADEMRDGEGLPAYLARCGGVALPLAAGWIAELLDEWEGAAMPCPGEALSRPESFEVVRTPGGGVRLVLCGLRAGIGANASAELGGAPETGGAGAHLAHLFERLVQGRPGPLPGGVAEAIRRGSGGASLREALGACGELSDRGGEIELPRSPLLEWIRGEWEAAGVDTAERRFPGGRGTAEERYAVSAKIRGSLARLQILPGPLSLPRDGWLDQHHRATRRPGRGRAHQWQVNCLEDWESITLVGEECPTALGLGDWLAAVGPLDLETVVSAGRVIEAALVSQESSAPSDPVWWLPPENVFLIGDSDGFWTGDAVGQWGREIPMKFRLHQTLPTLMLGVGLPTRLREQAGAGSSGCAEVRRASVLLPLLWFLASGSRFDWDEVPAHRLVPPGVAGWFDHWRRFLAEAPETFPGSVVEALAAYRPEPEIVVEIGEREAPPQPESVATPMPERSREVPSGRTPSKKAMVRRSSTSAWCWTALAGAIAALVVGYGLSGWTFRQGPYPQAEALQFELPSARRSGGERFVPELSAFLLSEGSAGSLRLLDHLDRLGEDGETGDQLAAWLEGLHARGMAGAARLRAELAEWSKALEPSGETAWWHAAAKSGDAEAKYRYALDRLDDPSSSADWPEAVALLEEAAAVGHAAARVRLSGIRLEEGHAEEAFDWVRRAAEQGELPGIVALGVHYAEGIGCGRDPVRAAEQFRIAAERGDGRAMFEYGRCHAEGFGLPVSYPEALRWMRLSASLGHAPARQWLQRRGLVLRQG